MKSVEQMELDAHRKEIVADVRDLVEKYRKVFDWDIAEVDQRVADKLILGEVRAALDDLQRELLGYAPPL